MTKMLALAAMRGECLPRLAPGAQDCFLRNVPAGAWNLRAEGAQKGKKSQAFSEHRSVSWEFGPRAIPRRSDADSPPTPTRLKRLSKRALLKKYFDRITCTNPTTCITIRVRRESFRSTFPCVLPIFRRMQPVLDCNKPGGLGRILGSLSQETLPRRHGF